MHAEKYLSDNLRYLRDISCFPLIALMYAEKYLSDNLRYLRDNFLFPADRADVRRKSISAIICGICGSYFLVSR